MTVFFFYAEFASVFLYGQIPSEDYAFINAFTKVVLLFIGAASVLSTPLWNYGKHTLGELDRISISTSIYVPIFLLGIVGYAAFSTFFLTEINFYGYGVDLIFLGLIITVASVGNLFLSQILARLAMNKQALVLSSAELLSMLLILVLYSDVIRYLNLWSIVVVSKYFAGYYMLRGQNG